MPWRSAAAPRRGIKICRKVLVHCPRYKQERNNNEKKYIFLAVVPSCSVPSCLVSNRIIDALDFKRAQVETDAAGSLDFDSILSKS